MDPYVKCPGIRLINRVYEDIIMVAFSGYLDAVAIAFSLTAGEAGIMMSLFWIAFIDALVGIGTGSGIAVVAVSAIGIIAFSAMGWFPVWSGAVLAIVFGLMFANAVREQF